MNDIIEPIEQENLSADDSAVMNGLDETDSEISFADLGLDEETLAAIERKGFKTPSPIQELAIPRLLNGEANIIARARTGTGKTAAFGLPIIQKLRGQTGIVKALILEPTRELAIQTCTELQSFTQGKSPRTCVLYGGASYSTQIRDLKRGSEVVVGTPGRIQDHLERGTLDISQIDYFILDEGDEMLDMGFIDDIEAIFKQANPAARILLFSATMPAPILHIAGEFMGDYEIVEEEGVLDEPLLIEQKVWIVREADKTEALVRLIDIADDFYGIVFTQTKSDADMVTKTLDEKGYEVAALHGDIAQTQREKIIAKFRTKKTRILVATDVAARGIDIKDLTYVVNYSIPFDGATYVHRIGRTGRAGREGTAVTFVAPNELRKLGFLRRAVQKASKGEMVEEKLPSVEQVLAKKRERLFGELKEKLGLAVPTTVSLSSDSDDEVVPLSEGATASGSADFAEGATSTGSTENTEVVQENTSVTGGNLRTAPAEFAELAKELTANNDATDVLAAVLSVLYGEKLDKKRYGKITQPGNPADQTRLYIQLGKRDGYNPRALAEYFSKMLHIPGRLVDRIDISSNFSLVSLPKEAAKKALALARSDRSVPHMHVDVKDGGFSGSKGRGGSRRSFGEGSSDRFEGRRTSYGFKGRDGRDSREGREFREGRSKERSARPNFHTPTERSGSAGLYKQKKKSKAERF